MLPRSNDLLHASVVISELPARRMPAPTPLPTLKAPGLFSRLEQWWSQQQPQPARPARRSAQVLLLRA